MNVELDTVEPVTPAPERGWLGYDEQDHWRAWVAVTTLLPDRLNRDLQQAAGISLPDYEILVRLSEAPDRRLRMSDLANVTLSSRSRLSHQIDRMEAAGLVDRVSCTEDRRGQFAAMTARGWETLVAAAPHHVDSVRAHLVDVLTPEQFAALGDACRAIAAHLEQLPHGLEPSACH